ncbi:DUF2203 domain-containing protein [Paenibacillus arenilitoris]|uniref:DUF2203 domain-containing protein n=1 Tax=Paenibacillus arenilitoris TaxID=2772299 RepID=A0A927CNJ3_9BACL|nr:DUF2203 domain-containing protein [Paenibacillus arenilitoris]MBD2869421.1 DUF2203 domain-containing protein [Paenibacillus arenilitoris]
MEHKLFTLSEANALLPQLKEDLRKLQEATDQFERLYIEYQQAKESFRQTSGLPSGSLDPFFELESKLDFMKIETDLLIENFTRKGVLLKMINPGLIDFPAVLDGEEILICWKEGEESASHYHGWHDGFAGRKPFP